MFFNQELKGCRVVSHGALAVAIAALAAGCSWLPWGHAHPSATPAAQEQVGTPVASADATSGPTPTATERAIAEDGAAHSLALPEQPQAVPLPVSALNPTAPKRYTVRQGDTLWGIAQMYLRDPWLWPEIWYVNPAIQNPHLIYPGDVLALAYGADGHPLVRLAQAGAARLEAAHLDPTLRSTPINGAIPVVPYSTIAAFLSRPALLANEEISHAAHVVAFRDEHQAVGAGDELYARTLDAPEGAHYTVLHVGDSLRDPESGKVLGYEGLYVGTAVMVRRGNPAKLQLVDAQREALRGDLLFPDNGASPLAILPRAPAGQVKGRIMAVVDNVHLIGQFNIIAINRGKQHGVDAGTVLAIDQAGEVVPDRGPHGWDNFGRSDFFAPKVRLPNEREGTLLVFKAYDNMSWALVVGATEPIQVADVVRNP
ncbi:MAG TPA: LysM peptidoglycan-binding domain-containing protein [Steroidobacteraceae bacterium]|nr:LysM peptidoglycan-binding domain-containing protein [Steroidobacteraceae bacterium]